MRKKAELTIVIDAERGIVPINSFVTVLNNTIGVLRGLAEAIDKDIEVEWAITKISMKSPLMLTITGQNKRKPAFPRKVIGEYMGGLRSIEQKKKLPKNFSDTDLDSVQKIVGVLKDVNTVAFKSSEYGQVTPTMHANANIQQLRVQAYHSEITTFNGKLYDIRTSDDHHEFVIQEEATGQKIKCIFPETEIDRLSEGFLHKQIEVYGKARFTDKGVPVAIEIHDFDKIPDPKYLKISEAPPMDITGGIDPVDYVRKIRNGERF